MMCGRKSLARYPTIAHESRGTHNSLGHLLQTVMCFALLVGRPEEFRVSASEIETSKANESQSQSRNVNEIHNTSGDVERGGGVASEWEERAVDAVLHVPLTDEVRYLNEWVVELDPNCTDPQEIARRLGCQFVGPVKGFRKHFIFRHSSHPARSKREATRLTHHLLRDLQVTWAEQQTSRPRVKRDAFRLPYSFANAARYSRLAPRFHGPGESMGMFLSNGDPLERGIQPPIPFRSVRFNDPLWERQWYLRDTRNVPTLPEWDHRVMDVWNMGYTGAGSVVAIMDDGIWWNHTDLIGNYDPKASYDANGDDPDPFPRYDAFESNSHGTRCAGEVAMTANNGACGVGVAYNANIGGIRCLDGEVSDRIEAVSILHNIQHIQIFSASWGPTDDGQTVDGPKKLAREALEKGVTEGRGGKGVLYVWASGNGGTRGDNCNADGYASSPFTISIGAATQQGSFPWYGEKCASTFAIAYSSGAYTEQKIATTDLKNRCTVDHSGTSAAAPLAAGIFALLLEANGNLTYRDVMHLIAWTSEFRPLMDNRGWHRNAMGILYNTRFGFGLLNALAMVNTALSWTNVPPKRTCIIKVTTRLPARIQSGRRIYIKFNSNGCAGTPNEVNFLEHVSVRISLEYSRRGNLDMYLKSPLGTESMLMSRRPRDTSSQGYKDWPLVSVHFWGETSSGEWSFMLRDKNGNNEKGSMLSAELILEGSRERPFHMRAKRSYGEDEDLMRQTIDPRPEWQEDEPFDQNSMSNSLGRVHSMSQLDLQSLMPLVSARANNKYAKMAADYGFDHEHAYEQDRLIEMINSFNNPPT